MENKNAISLIELAIYLKKTIIELEIKSAVSLTPQGIEAQLEKAKAELEKCNEKLKGNKISSLVISQERTINKIGDEIRSFDKKALNEAMRGKTGEEYKSVILLLTLLKRNYENRNEIAKINLLIGKLDKDNATIVKRMLQEWEFEEMKKLNLNDKKLEKLLHTLISRIRISFGDPVVIEEVPLNLNERRVWVPKEFADAINQNLDKIRIYSTKIHIFSAEKQSNSLNADKEKEFAQLQEEYLKVLKEQDEILKDFNNEEDLLS